MFGDGIRRSLKSDRLRFGIKKRDGFLCECIVFMRFVWCFFFLILIMYLDISWFLKERRLSDLIIVFWSLMFWVLVFLVVLIKLFVVWCVLFESELVVGVLRLMIFVKRVWICVSWVMNMLWDLLVNIFFFCVSFVFWFGL